MTERIKIGVVGAGAFGIRYIEALRSIHSVDLSFVCDLNSDLCQSVASKYGVANVSSDYRLVCDDPSLDAIVVVTPESAHRDIAVAALEGGKHVIVEKPLATNEEDAVAMASAAHSAGKLLMPAFLLRFDYRYGRLHQQIVRIGKIHNI
jgi:predicted dehydrogenase